MLHLKVSKVQIHYGEIRMLLKVLQCELFGFNLPHKLLLKGIARIIHNKQSLLPRIKAQVAIWADFLGDSLLELFLI